MFDRGGGEGRAGGGGGRRTNIGWRRGERRRGGGGEAAGPGVDYRGSCGNISQTAGGRGLTTAEPQNKHLHGSGSMVWKSGRRTGTLSSAPWPKKTPKKRNGKSTGTLQSVLIPKYLGLLCRSCANFKCVFFWSICRYYMVGSSSPRKKAVLL